MGILLTARQPGITNQQPTFSDILALVRRRLWGNFAFPTARSDPDVVLLPRATLAQLAYAVCY